MSWYEILGWAGNACFFSRFLIQWLASERAKRTVAPRVFWWISMAGTIALGVYSVAIGEPVLLAGYAVNGAIYVRNLKLRDREQGLSTVALVLGAALATGLLFLTGLARPRADWASSKAWFLVALVGQVVWSARFILQWWKSERRGASHFPVSFWWVSLIGNALLLAYALHIADAVLIAGYAIGPVVQVRNLMLAAQAARRDAAISEPVRELVPKAPPTVRTDDGAAERSQPQEIGRNAGGVPE